MRSVASVVAAFLFVAVCIAPFANPSPAYAQQDLVQVYTGFIKQKFSMKWLDAKQRMQKLMRDNDDITKTHVDEQQRDQVYNQTGQFGATPYSQEPQPTADAGIKGLAGFFGKNWSSLFSMFGGAFNLGSNDSGLHMASNAEPAGVASCVVENVPARSGPMLASPIVLARPIAGSNGPQKDLLRTETDHYNYQPNSDNSSPFQVQEKDDQQQGCSDDDHLAPKCGGGG